MQHNGQLNPGFIAIEDAIKLIEKDKRDKATVDLKWMARNVKYVNEFKNFRIPLMESDEKGRAHESGETYVYVATAYDKEMLRHAIREAYKNRTGQEVDAEGVYNRTTVYDPEYNTSSKIVSSPHPNTEKGQALPTNSEVK